MPLPVLLLAVFSLTLAACQPPTEENLIAITLIADGTEQTYSYADTGTIAEFLADAQIELGEQDRISHPPSTQLADGMLITIRRVVETQSCQQEDIPFARRYVRYEGVPAGEEQLATAGQPGMQEACYRIIFEDGVETQRIPGGQPTLLTEPTDEIIYVGPSQEAAPIAIAGRLSYINNGNVWTITGSTAAKRPLTRAAGLDARVFDQNDDGTLLVYTQESNSGGDFFNELWMIGTADNATPRKLAPTDVLYAEWRPQRSSVLAYSTGEIRPAQPPWHALNNLWLMDIDEQRGFALSIEEIIPESSGGAYDWWGIDFRWSPQGDRMAWVSADGMGLVDIAENELIALLDYPPFDTTQFWVWLSPLSWSHDGQLIASVVHRLSAGSAFDLAVTSADGRFSASVKTGVGMWAAPDFSPPLAANSAYPQGFLAWLQARPPHSSIYSQYDLVVADRDSSNQRVIFPPAGQAGVQIRDFSRAAKPFAWSPDARFIAIVYQGDLWLVDVQTAESHQVTFDGGATNPVWTR